MDKIYDEERTESRALPKGKTIKCLLMKQLFMNSLLTSSATLHYLDLVILKVFSNLDESMIL